MDIPYDRPTFAIVEEEAVILLLYFSELEKVGVKNAIFCRDRPELECELNRTRIDYVILGQNKVSAVLEHDGQRLQMPYFLVSPWPDRETATEMGRESIREGCIGILTRIWYRSLAEIEEMQKLYEDYSMGKIVQSKTE